MSSTNWTDSSINSTDYTDTAVNSTGYGDGRTYILASSTVVTAGSTAYDARGLLVGTNTTYSTDWSST